jgi:hypothetical protein
MAHFAELDENNIVKRVIVVHNNELIDENGQESEAKGVAFCKNLYGSNTNWVQTSYSGSFRRFFAGTGFTYNQTENIFIYPQPYLSWLLDNNFDWQPPTPKPIEGIWYWDEPTLAWIEFDA